MITDYLAFDLETANSSPNSICSMGFVVVKNRRIIRRSEYFLCPPDLNFHQRNTFIHGIEKDDVVDAPSFDQLWPSISSDFLSYPIVAHNASFDLNCLSKALSYYGLEEEFQEVYCTYKLSGKKLDVLCDELNVPLNHHNALADATACAIVFDYLVNETGDGMIKDFRFKPSRKSKETRKTYHSRIDRKYFTPLEEVDNPMNPFYKKKVVITGVFNQLSRNELASILHKCGANVNGSVSGRTDYLIAGENMGPSKKEKAEKLGVSIISEDDFIKMLD